jgi:hypothetical protein
MMLTSPLSGDPALSKLTAALAAAPALTTLRTPPRAVGACVCCGRGRPALGRICLRDDLGSPSPSSTTSTPATATSSTSTSPSSAPPCPSTSASTACDPSSPTSKHTPACPGTPLLLSPLSLPRTEKPHPLHRALPLRRAPPHAPERAG